MSKQKKSVKARLRSARNSTYSSRALLRLPLAFEFLEDRHLLAVDLPPLVDINPTLSATGSSPSQLTEVAGVFYFTATTSGTGLELWKSDGTAAGTMLVKDIRVGAYGSDPTNLTNVNGTLFFKATEGATGSELWKSDGTALGTVLVKDIYSGTRGSNPSYLTNLNGTLYFDAYDGATGSELWKSDGTGTGTVLVKDILPGYSSGFPLSGSPLHLTAVNSNLYFTADDGVNGRELWKSDGTVTGTQLVKNNRPGSSSSFPSSLTNLNGTLYFSSNDGTYGNELWKSNGTAEGTSLVKDIKADANGSYPSNLENLNGTLFFDTRDSINGHELWKSDGTAAGTSLVSGLSSGPFSNFTNVSGTLYFTSEYGHISSGYYGYYGHNGERLWKSDGTAAGTVLVKDFHLDTYGANLGSFTNFNGSLYFRANDGNSGYELWKSDGMPAGTSVIDINAGVSGSGPASLINFNGTLYFSADNGVNGSELWKSDGAGSGTNLLNDIRRGTNSSNSSVVTGLNGMLYFNADGGDGSRTWQSNGTSNGTTEVTDMPASFSGNTTIINGMLFGTAYNPASGVELWKSDGTAAGTVLVKDIRTGTGSSNPTSFNVLNGVLYFVASDGLSGYELWKSDGTSDGTVLVSDIRTGSTDSQIRNLNIINGMLYFTADDGIHGDELWKSDGTDAGTVLVNDIRPGVSGSKIRSFTAVGSTLYFNADDGVHGDELWKSDGTAAGTLLVRDILRGFPNTFPGNLTNVNGTLFFSIRRSQGYELWKSDGTADGTDFLKITGPIQELTNLNGTLFFTGNFGRELWTSNGTRAGTGLVKDIFAVDLILSPRTLTNLNGTLFFLASDGVHGNELWKSDGTAAGTVLVKDINPGASGIPFSYLTKIDGSLYFLGNDGIHGEELWKSDGTAIGTFMVIDVAVGGSSPANLFQVDNKLFFTASTDSYGRELYVVNIHNTPQDVALSSSSIAENLAANTTVGTFSTTDPDGGDSFTYSLVAGVGDQDNAQFSIVNDQLKALRSFDFETKSSYSVRVRSTDKAGLYFEKTFMISVTDTGSLDASIDVRGYFFVFDIDPVGKDNRLTIKVVSNNVVVADANEEFQRAPAGWTLSADSKSLSRPLAGLVGPIFIFTQSGADQLTIDFSGGVIANPFVIDGGVDTSQDKVVITGITSDSVSTSFLNANSGKVDITGVPQISYENVDSVNLDIRAVDVVVNIPTSAVLTPVTLGDDGVVGNATLKVSGVPVTTIFRRPTGTLSLVGGNSGVTVNGLLDLRSNLVLGTAAAPLSSIDFAGPVPVAVVRNRSLSAYATNAIVLSTPESDLTTSGTGSVQLNSTSSIQLLAGSSINTENGSIFLSANQQAASSTANSIGIDVEGATIQSTQGAITLRGKGGASTNDSNIGVIVAGALVRSLANSINVTGTGGGSSSSSLNHGVRVNAGGVIGGGSNVTVIGNAGTSVTSANNFGVTVFDTGSQITSSGGVVTVTGVGGGNIAGTGGTNHGVRVTNGGAITSTGTSSVVSVTGTGGASSGINNTGVQVVNAGSQITSSSGNVFVNGTGGGNSASKQNYGIWINSAGAITSTGAHLLNVSGTGGNSTGSGTENYGLSISGAGSKVSATSGVITVTAAGTTNSDAMRLTNGGSINNSSSSIILKADSMTFSGVPSGTVSAGTGLVSISPRTAGTQIALGGSDQLSTTPLTLGLSAAELNQISATSLKIGSVDSGKLTVSASISRSAVTNLSLASANEIEIASQINTAGGTLVLQGGLQTTVRPTAAGIDANASSLTLSASLTLDINSGVVNTGYTQLRVAGSVNLSGTQLLIGGNTPTVTGKETLTIVSANSIAGTFLGLADGSLVNVHGYLYKIKYSATTVQLIGQARLFDFDHSAAITTASGYQSVLPTDLYSTAKGYGWNAAVTSLARTTASAEPAVLYLDKHVSSAQRTFIVSAEVGKAYSLRVLLGDQTSRSVAISVDGGTTFRTIATAANQYRSELFTGIVATSDRLEIRIKSGNTTPWAVDGIEVMQVANAPALPLRLTPRLSTENTLSVSNAINYSPMDVNRDGLLSPLDALWIINFLNHRSNSSMVLSEQELLALDADGSGEISPMDALLVINALNNVLNDDRFNLGGEGESTNNTRLFAVQASTHPHDAFFADSLDENYSRRRRI